MEIVLEPIVIGKPKRITLADIVDQAERAVSMMSEIRSAMLSPTSRKSPPRFNSTQVAALCGIDKGHMAYRITKGDLPGGELNSTRSRREFSLGEARQWVREYRQSALRPAGAEAVTISIGNFKGGVSKTTTAVTLAQGLSLRGHKVLVVDTDAQGSLTTLFGILPDTEVDDGDTILPLCTGAESSIRYAIRPSYWDGIDLVAAAPLLYGAEFALPARQARDPEFEFWNVLHYGLDDVRAEYDVIVIDTPPALSYTTINAFMASDGLIMPLPPNALDFASAAQFWSLFSDLAGGLLTNRGLDKTFEFIHVLMSRVDSSDAASAIVRTWISSVYTDKVLPVEIPKTAVTATASAEFGTVYDLSRYDGNLKTFKRAKDAYERVTELIEGSVQAVWRRQLEGEA